MAKESYTASKTRSKRPGWSITFRHPLRNDARGRAGLKMRRGLGTSDESEAEAMVGEMNTILSDQTWWNAAQNARRQRSGSQSPSSRLFMTKSRPGGGIPRAFASPTSGCLTGMTVIRGCCSSEQRAPVRRRCSVNSSVQILTRTGFPSTAPAKTTIADIEVVQDSGEFEAAVTFFTEFQAQANIEECVIDAALTVLENAPRDRVADRFLSHRDQKFRLSYILGAWSDGKGVNDDDEVSFEEAPESPAVPKEEGTLGDAERGANRAEIAVYLDRIGQLTKSVVAKLAEDLGVDIKVAGPDRDIAQQLIEENFDAYLTQDEGFHELESRTSSKTCARALTGSPRANYSAASLAGQSCGSSNPPTAPNSFATSDGFPAITGRNLEGC